MILRDYQQQAIDSIRDAFRRKVRRVVLVSPTGSGKTVMFSYITKGALQKSKRITILVHRAELVDQVSASLKEFDVPHGIVAAGFPMQPDYPVQVASVWTLVKRLPKLKAPDLLVVDEAHHTVATTWDKITEAYKTALILGVTATPCRASGDGLDTCFDEMILGPSTMDLIEQGSLSPLRVYAPPGANLEGVRSRMGDFITSQLSAAVDKPKVTGDAVAHYQRITPGAPAVVFCVSVEHVRHVAAQFISVGINALGIDGTLDRETRRSIIADYRAGKITVLTSCDLVNEGFDFGGIVTGISLRPTQSLGLWIQQTGRILRIADGKKEAFLLDHAGNSLRHGLPTDDREWSLRGNEEAKGGEKAKPGPRICGTCFAANKPGAQVCFECKTAFPVEAREVDAVEGELEEIDVMAARIAMRREQAKADSLEGLRELAKLRGYAPGWANHIWAAREKKRLKKETENEQQQSPHRTGESHHPATEPERDATF